MKALHITSTLAEQDPANAMLARNLFISYLDLAQVVEQSDPSESRYWWREAYDQLVGMKQRGIMLPTDEQYLAVLRGKAE